MTPAALSRDSGTMTMGMMVSFGLIASIIKRMPMAVITCVTMDVRF